MAYSLNSKNGKVREWKDIGHHSPKRVTSNDVHQMDQDFKSNKDGERTDTGKVLVKNNATHGLC